MEQRLAGELVRRVRNRMTEPITTPNDRRTTARGGRRAGRVRRAGVASGRGGSGARRRICPLGRPQPLRRPRHGTGHGHPIHPVALDRACRRNPRRRRRDADAVVDERHQLSDHDQRQTAFQPAGQHPHHVRVAGAAQRVRGIWRRVGAEPLAAVLALGLLPAERFSKQPPTVFSSPSRRPTRSSMPRKRRSSWNRCNRWRWNSATIRRRSRQLPSALYWSVAVLVVLSLLPPLLIARYRAVPKSLPRIHPILDMDLQPKYLPQGASPLFADGRAMRPPVPGTVAQGQLDAGWGGISICGPQGGQVGQQRSPCR